jgi:hypothetical protein
MKYFRRCGPIGRMFQKACWIMILSGVLVCLFLPCLAQAAGEGKSENKVYNVADTRDMKPGISKWIADIYNSNLVLYGITVVLVMAFMGAILGFGMDRIVRLFGIDLGKLEHHHE